MIESEFRHPPIRVALVGLGRAMFESHYPIFKNHPSLFTVICACDPVKERRDLILKDYPDCRMYRKLPDMLRDSDIDLVDIATPSREHARHAVMSLKHGHWTLLETPVTLTSDETLVLKGAAIKAKGRLIVHHRGLFDPDFLLARRAMTDKRLGHIHRLSIRREDYIRRDDWQCINRLGGGASYYEMTDLIFQGLKLLGTAPCQMWSDLKRVASLGDAEDFVHLELKTRELISADIEYSGGVLPADRSPSFKIWGEYGSFAVMPGAKEGVLTVVDPAHKFPRRRSSVRTPPMVDMHEDLPVKSYTLKLPEGTNTGPTAFWKYVYATVRRAAPFPYTMEDYFEAVKYSHLMKKTSIFAN